MNPKHKEEIEKRLLEAMKWIDNAVYLIADKDKYGPEIAELLTAKSKIKKVLNKSFDKLAK